MIEHPFTKGRHITAGMRAMLIDLAPRVVVIGSVARGKADAKDLDLLFDFDNEASYQRVSRIIEEHRLPYESCVIGHWCFRQGTMIEVMGIHYGKSYRQCRRQGMKYTLWGVEMTVAPSESA